MESVMDFVPIIVIGVVLVVGWVLLRMALKLTATLFKIGCFFIFLVVAAGALLTLL